MEKTMRSTLRVLRSNLSQWVDHGWVLSLIALLSGGASYFWFSPNPGMALAGLGLGWGLCWLFVRGGMLQPLAKLTAATRSLEADDVITFAGAMVQLAQGDLTLRLNLHTQAMPQAGSAEVRRLAETLTELQLKFKEGAKEFNLLMLSPCRRLCFLGNKPPWNCKAQRQLSRLTLLVLPQPTQDNSVTRG
jgi:hypothetical protein